MSEPTERKVIFTSLDCYSKNPLDIGVQLAVPLSLVLVALRHSFGLQAITLDEKYLESIRVDLERHADHFCPAVEMEEVEGGGVGSFVGVRIRCAKGKWDAEDTNHG